MSHLQRRGAMMRSVGALHAFPSHRRSTWRAAAAPRNPDAPSPVPKLLPNDV